MPIIESTESEYESDTSGISGSSKTSAHISKSTEREIHFSLRRTKRLLKFCALSL